MKNVTEAGHLLDMGCGTGLDAVYLASHGYFVTAMDWSPEMAGRARQRASQSNLADRVEVKNLGVHQLEEFQPESFDAAYSDLGPLNCVMNIDETAHSIAKILKPQGMIIATVIGRICPWEWFFYIAKGRWKRASLRLNRGLVSVPLNNRRVWMRYYSPRDFKNIFERSGFELVSRRTLGLFVPPPYAIKYAGRHPRLINTLQAMDDSLGHWPILREWGDHFLLVMRKK